MTDFQQQAVKLAAQQQPLAWLQDFRAAAANQWLAQAWPTRKTEHWKYTPLQGLQKTVLSSWGQAADAAQDQFIPLDALRLVFVNGVFDVAASTASADYLVRFSQANAEQHALIQKHLGTIVEGECHLFATLNNAWLDDGVLLHVPRNVILDKPVYIVNLTTAAASA